MMGREERRNERKNQRRKSRALRREARYFRKDPFGALLLQGGAATGFYLLMKKGLSSEDLKTIESLIDAIDFTTFQIMEATFVDKENFEFAALIRDAQKIKETL